MKCKTHATKGETALYFLLKIVQQNMPLINSYLEAFKEALTKVKLQLIEFLVRKLRKEKRRWLPVEEIYQFAKEELQLDSSKVAELLSKLVKQGIERAGIL